MGREAVEMRAQVEKKMANKEKEGKEKELRALAKMARDKRAGIRSPEKEDGGTKDEVKERDQIRKERHDQRARERNIARAAPGKQKELRSMEDRDVSEQIALGVPAKKTGDGLFDQRLFGQNKGLDGADSSAPRGSGPVQFERDQDEIFGIDKLLTEAKKGSKRGSEREKDDKSKSKRRKD